MKITGNYIKNNDEMVQRLKWHMKFMPIILIELYLWAGYGLYRFGVWKWPFREDGRAFIFILLCNMMLLFGYLLAYKIKIEKHGNTSFVIKPELIVAVCCVASIILYLPTCKLYTGYYYPPIIKALQDPAKVYNDVVLNSGNNTSVRIWGLFDIFIYCLLPVLIYYWENISKKLKVISILVALMYLFVYISCGKNIQVFMVVISLAIPYLLVLCKNHYSKDNKRVIRTTIIFFSYLLIAVAMFQWNLSSRTLYSKDYDLAMDKPLSGSGNGNYTDITYSNLMIDQDQINKYNSVYKIYPIYTAEYSMAYVNPEDSVLKALPISLRFLYIMGTGYLTNGYHGLTVSLHTEHQWTYGLGHSGFLMDYYSRFTGISVVEHSYYYRLCNSIKPQLVSESMWPSAYTQYADDITFPGVVVLMLFMGFLLYFIWIDAMTGKNPFSILLISQLAVLYLFLPANCILENSGGYCVTFYGIICIWILTKVLPLIKKG